EEAVLEEVLLDVGDVERAYGNGSRPGPAPDSADGLWPGEVAHDRDDQVLLLHRLDEPEVVLGGQIALRRAVHVRLEDHLFVGREPAATARSVEARHDGRVPQSRALPEECEVDGLELLQIGG